MYKNNLNIFVQNFFVQNFFVQNFFVRVFEPPIACTNLNPTVTITIELSYPSIFTLVTHTAGPSYAINMPPIRLHSNLNNFLVTSLLLKIPTSKCSPLSLSLRLPHIETTSKILRNVQSPFLPPHFSELV